MNKFGAKKTDYKGQVYASKKEAEFAQTLDLLKKARSLNERVICWERQIKYPVKIKGKFICNYYLDFMVHYANGTIRNIDVKGCRKGCAYQLFRLKKKLVEAAYHLIIEEV